ncbi:MAG TPA: hypothetical protein VK641_12470, partial [Terriglobales bacterium]|nr:hypothetical protein [Terriglobales bacterium]
MRLMVGLFLLGACMSAQTPSPSPPTLATPVPATNPNAVTVPAGTKLALELKHAISTKGTEEGAAV